MLKPQIVKTLPNVENFLRHCQRQVYKAKSNVLKQGETSDSLYLILEGSVSVMVEDEAEPGHLMVVAYLNPGDFVGEMGLFEQGAQHSACMCAHLAYITAATTSGARDAGDAFSAAKKLTLQQFHCRSALRGPWAGRSM